VESGWPVQLLGNAGLVAVAIAGAALALAVRASVRQSVAARPRWHHPPPLTSTSGHHVIVAIRRHACADRNQAVAV